MGIEMKIRSANDEIHVHSSEGDGEFTNHGGHMWAQDFETFPPREGFEHKDSSGTCPGGCPSWTHYGPDDFNPDDNDPWTRAIESNLDSTYGHVYDHTRHGGGFVGDVGYAGPGGSSDKDNTDVRFNDLESAMNHVEENRPLELGLDDRDSFNRDYGDDDSSSWNDEDY